MSATSIEAPSIDAVRAGTANLEVGQRGASVANAQFLLGIFDDGGFGQNTQRAVVAFQQKHGIVVAAGDEGKVGSATLVALEADNGPILASIARIDERNKKVHLHLAFRKKLAALADALAAKGMETLITDGFRTFAEQDEIFAQGRTKPGDIVTGSRGGLSNHNYGMAVDMYPVLAGRVFTEKPKGTHKDLAPRFLQIQQAVIDEAERIGLTSGVHFRKLHDTPHVQLFGEDVLNPHAALKIFNENRGCSLE